MRWMSCLVLLALAPAGASEVYRRVSAGLAERLTNPDLEQLADGALAGWSAYQDGYQPAPGQGRGGTLAAVCQRTDPAAPGAGLVQHVVLDQARPTALLVSGWSRAEAVSGSADANYSLYCDLTYADGTNLWGQIAPFPTGTGDWRRAEVVISPAKPVRSIAVYGLFRGHTGTAWFDDFSLAELGGNGVNLLDGVAVEAVAAEPPAGPTATLSAGPLALDLTGSRVTAVRLGDTPVTADQAVGGFLVRDVAAEGGFWEFRDGEALGLRLETRAEAVDGGLAVTASLTDLTGEDRAVTLLFALPIDAIGWQWGRDADQAEPIESTGWYGNYVAFEAGATGQLSRYPLANLAGPAGAVNLAIDPRRPAAYRLGYSGSARLFYLAWDLALPSGLLGQPARVELPFRLYSSDPAWGFRSALAGFHQLFAEQYQVRCERQGIWMAFAPISQVEGWEDFGFQFKEGDGETAWDDAHGIQTFRYSEMGTYWMTMPPELPREYDAAVRLLEQRAADPQAPGHQLAAATITSGMHDREGRYQLLFRREPWCDGAVFSLNPSPHLAGHTQAQVAWGPARRAAYERDSPVLDGEYLDSLEGYVTAPLNFREDHLRSADLPLTFTRDDRRPVLHKAFSIAEFVAAMATDVHGMGKLMFANAVPYRFAFLAVWFDLMGTETNWLRDGYTPDPDETMALRRAMAGAKPYLLLLNTRFAEFGPYVERYFARALAYGMFPSMFSHNASEDHYFRRPEWYNRDRELFRAYIPRIREVAEAGWQPVTGARCDSPAIHLERFGPGRDQAIFVTVHNPTDVPQRGTVSFEAATIGRPAADQVVTLAPYATEVIRL